MTITGTVVPRLPSRRGTEVALLAFALALTLAAYTQVGLTVRGAVPADLARYAAALGGLWLVAHLAVRRFAPYADPLLLPCAALLNGLGLVLIHRLDLAARAGGRTVGGTTFSGSASAQLAWTTIGIALFLGVLLLLRDHRVLQRYTYTAMFAGLALLALPALLPASLSEVNGSKIWVRLAGFSIQPGEFAKLVLLVFFAGYLVVKRDVLALASRRVLGLDLPRGRDMGPLVVAWVASMLVLVFERDLGTALLFYGLFVVLLYIATERRSWVILGLLLFLVGGYVAYRLFGHVRLRVDVWLHPFADPERSGYQIVQALFGLASGGVVGTGLGQGQPWRVPFANTDFIISTVGEELGVTGLMALLLLYGILVERGFRAALAARDSFGKLLAGGLAFTMALQVFIIAGGVLKLIPLTGLTTPFLSYGGSSLVANWALVALLLRISDSARRPAPPPPQAPDDAATQVVRL